LIVNSAIEKRAPFNQILTHGFVVDADGKKMSKSVGNVVSPQQVTNKLGADILRLWVASTDYSAELNISDEILKRVTDTYRRIRNTIRFLISNLEDFDETSFKSSNFTDFSEIDLYMINYNKVFEEKVRSLYQAYEFHTLVNYIKTYCSEQLGSFYLDIVKDRLYTEKSDSKIRKSCQVALNEILQSLLYSLTPILSFTVNEAWTCFKKNDEYGEIFLKEWTDTNIKVDNEIIYKWDKILEIREKVNKEIENIRGKNIIGSSLESIVEINACRDDYKLLTSISENLEDIFITSEVFLKSTDLKKTEIIISKHSGLKCERCWKYFNKLYEYEGINQLCDRCLDNLK
jgi:isoleucyl-tRNA synthetase